MSAVAQMRRVEAWQEGNRQYVMARVSEVKACLMEWLRLRGLQVPSDALTPAQAAAGVQAAREQVQGPTALDHIRDAFELSGFEESVIVACAACELDTMVGSLCGQALGEAHRRGFTFALAMSVFPEAHWTVVTPDGPLRRWRLVELAAGSTLTGSGLRLDERVLHSLLGTPQVDPRLSPLLGAMGDPDLLPSQVEVVQAAAIAWKARRPSPCLPLQIYGGDAAVRLDLAAGIAAESGLRPMLLGANGLPAAPQEMENFVRLWEREARLDSVCLVLDCGEENDAARQAVIAGFASMINGAAILVVPQPLRGLRRSLFTIEAARPSVSEQLDCWQAVVEPCSEQTRSKLPEVAEQFRFSPSTIRAIWEEHRAAPRGTVGDGGEQLWAAARRHARGALEELAQRLTDEPGEDALVLPELQKEILRQIAAQVKWRRRVHQEWGFAAAGTRGLGLGVLFSGPPGTGKTLAAEVLAAKLKLDLYRIDLSAVVSKYIGDTEKNLRRVFDAAEQCGAILLFDEADSLFGQRSEVKDSMDRYANLEVSYLLQRMEAYRGLAILTTNRKRAIDPAFLRRLRFVVEFPFPDALLRAEIWRRVFPSTTPVRNLDYVMLARLDIAGGNIRNIAINAAFLSAERESAVTMENVLAAARAEYAKLDRPLAAAEFGVNG